MNNSRDPGGAAAPPDIVDSGCRVVEAAAWPEIAGRVPDPIVRNLALPQRPGRPGILPPQAGWPDLAGRMHRDRPADAVVDLAAARARFGAAAAVVVPSGLLAAGLHPQPEVEANLAFAYAGWAMARLAPDPALFPLLVLPLRDPQACLRLVEAHAGAPGIGGFLVPAATRQAVHDNALMPAWAAIERAALPVVFHAGYQWTEDATAGANRFLAVQALSGPHFLMTHATNWLVNALPERFPALRVVWMGGGLAWIPYLGQRLDTLHRMRPSEAPGLTAAPSAYLRRMWYGTQPVDVDADGFAAVVRAVGTDALLWASGYPAWDFDAPAAIAALDGVDAAAAAAILGGNARRVFPLGAVRP